MSEIKDTSRSVLPSIFLTVFIDMLGVGIIIPIMAPLLLDPGHGMLAADTLPETRNIILGFLVAIFPLMQFFGAPVLGALSDKHGRRKILLLSLTGTMVGYLLFAYGIYTQNIQLVFFSRALDGFTGGNIATAMSAISDVSTAENKSRNFGMIGAAFGIGFVVGPYIGGKLADPGIVSWFNSAVPLLFAALLTFINLLLVFFRLPETLKTPRNTAVSFATGFRNVGKAFARPDTRVVFTVVFLFTLGFTFFTQFYQVFLYHKFNYNISQIADTFAVIGIWIVIGQGGVMRPVSKRFKAHQVLKVSVLVLSFSLLAIVFPDNPSYMYFIIPFISIAQGLTQPNTSTIVSNSVPADRQGEILGINQSVQAMAMAIPPVIAAYLTNININLPTITAAGIVFLGWLIFMIFYKGPQAVDK